MRSRPDPDLDRRPVLVLTNERDFAADLVIERLNAQRVPVERWNTPGEGAATWGPTSSQLAEYRSVWLRQILPEPSALSTVVQVDDFLVAREHWRTWLAALADEPGPRWLNPLWAGRRAENKLTQLRTASEVGFVVPETLVTSHREEAVKFHEAVGDCVVKAVSAGYFGFSDSAFMFTRPLRDALAYGADEWAAQPVIVQQRIPDRTDVRVFMLGDFSCAVSTRVDVADWRTRSGDAQWQRCAAPRQVVEACRTYLGSFDLAYGAFDFAVDPDGRWWFLECNQAGEFAFVDRDLKLGVSAAIARWLAGTGRVKRE